VLDLGAGSGAFALRLLDHGYSVEAADLDISDWTVSSVPVHKVDMNNQTWGILSNKIYDAVVGIEVIEHLENPTQFLRNVSCLLKENGIFLFTTPNTVDLDSRRLMLTKGEFWLFRCGTLYSTGHLSILPYWLLEELLVKEGYQVVERAFIGKKARHSWRRLIVPVVNLFFLPIGVRIPLEAAFASGVAFLCTPKSGKATVAMG
jgi:SAM-dependent methyltransferase